MNIANAALSVPYQSFLKFKRRSIVWEKNGFPDADERIPEIVRIINRFRNIAAVYSCEGHTHDPVTGQHSCPFYLMLCVNQKGIETILKIYSKLSEKILSSLNAVEEKDRYPYPSSMHLEIGFKSRPNDLEDFSFGFYNAFVINARTNNEFDFTPSGPKGNSKDIKEIFFKHLKDSLKETLIEEECELVKFLPEEIERDYKNTWTS